MSYSGRGFGGGGGFGGSKPVETGKEYDVHIVEIARQGDGIARVQGFIIFVKGARVGEKIKIRITNVGARFATAEKVADGSATQQEQKTELKQVAPAISEQEKPVLQDYKSQEEHPPTG